MRPLLPLLLLGVGACAYWQRDPAALEHPVPAKQSAEIWTGGKSYLVESLVVRGDTVHARLDPAFNEGDDSAFVLPRAAVDSVNLRHPAVGGTIALVAVALLAGLAFAIQQSLGGPGS